MSKGIIVADIVKDWLKKHGYDGLYSWDAECGCELDDLMPCGECMDQCEAGYKVNCTEECEHGDGFKEGNWHIQLTKP